VLAAVLFLLFFFRLGAHGLVDPDEPRYAGSAREMMDSGDIWIPRFNGEVRIVKPILPYWFIIASYRVFGTSEFAARFPSALSGVAAVLLTAWIGFRFLGPRGGWLAALILAASPLHAVVSRLAIPDPAVALFVTGTHAAFLFHYRGGGSSRRALVGFYLAAAAGFLVKGPVAVLLPVLTILVFLASRRDLAFLRRMGALWGIPLFLAVALPWYAWVASSGIGGPGVFFRETVGRYLGLHEFHERPLPYLLGVLAAGYFPWVLHAALGVGAARPRSPGWIGTYLVAWLVTGLVFLTLSPNKQPSYVLPLRARWTGWVEVVVALGAAGVGAHLLIRQDPDAGGVAALLAALLVAYSIGIAPVVRLRPVVRFLIRVGGVVAVSLWALFFLAPRIEAQRSSKVFEGVLIPGIGPDDLLVEGWFHRPGLVFYARHRVLRIDSVEAIVRNLRKSGRMYCLLEEKNYRRVVERLAEPPEILFRDRGEVLFRDRDP
jgi:4-amino-4-deoxy-L-arabinose transferase-like glycosyltransferase